MKLLAVRQALDQRSDARASCVAVDATIRRQRSRVGHEFLEALLVPATDDSSEIASRDQAVERFQRNRCRCRAQAPALRPSVRGRACRSALPAPAGCAAAGRGRARKSDRARVFWIARTSCLPDSTTADVRSRNLKRRGGGRTSRRHGSGRDSLPGSDPGTRARDSGSPSRSRRRASRLCSMKRFLHFGHARVCFANRRHALQHHELRGARSVSSHAAGCCPCGRLSSAWRLRRRARAISARTANESCARSSSSGDLFVAASTARVARFFRCRSRSA